MGLEKQEPLPFEEPEKVKGSPLDLSPRAALGSESPQRFIKEKTCPLCGFDLGDNPENCFVCQHQFIKRKE